MLSKFFAIFMMIFSLKPSLALECKGVSFFKKNSLYLSNKLIPPYTKYLFGHNDYLSCPEYGALIPRDGYFISNYNFNGDISTCEWPGGTLESLRLVYSKEENGKFIFVYTKCNPTDPLDKCVYNDFSWKIIFESKTGIGTLYFGWPNSDNGEEVWMQYSNEFICSLEGS